MMFNKSGISVSNGRQTDSIEEMSKYFMKGWWPSEIILEAQKKWTYEPDKPNHTPRISGFMPFHILPDIRPSQGIIKRFKDGSADKTVFEIGDLLPGSGRLITTYAGTNQNPLPAFDRCPLAIDLKGNNAEEIAREFYDALGQGENDFRVSVAAACSGRGEYDKAVVNRHP